MKKKSIIALSSAAAVVLTMFIGSAVYVNDYYRAEDSVAEYVSQAVPDDDGSLLFEAEGSDIGFIFYPGGKVEYTAYAPLMKAISEKGINCVLMKMPFNLAVFDINAADGIAEKYPDIRHWYIGGHSLGGAMAASYAKGHTDSLEGLVLLGAYSTEDYNGTGMKVISIYGSEDKVLDREKYEEYHKNLPENTSEIVIDGGCHSYFGSYGHQDGDGEPTISGEAQIGLTAQEIAVFVQ